ncbi:hypothetical protein BGW41_006704 [Actinomortierella wolfii]|nr:hypothetical protein BGW41_006704 [Actinomortierella wolfii]
MAWSIAQSHHKDHVGSCSVVPPPPQLDPRSHHDHHHHSPVNSLFFRSNHWFSNNYHDQQQQQQQQQGACGSHGQQQPPEEMQSSISTLLTSASAVPVLIALLSVAWASLRYGSFTGNRRSSSSTTTATASSSSTTTSLSSHRRHRTTTATQAATASKLIEALALDLSAWMEAALRQQRRRRRKGNENATGGAHVGSRLFERPERAGTATLLSSSSYIRTAVTGGQGGGGACQNDRLDQKQQQKQQQHPSSSSSSAVGSSSPQHLKGVKEEEDEETTKRTRQQHAPSSPSLSPLPFQHSLSTSSTTTTSPTATTTTTISTDAPARVLGEQDTNALFENGRTWDHVLIGEGIETLEPAIQLARQYPSRSILILAHRCQLDQRLFPRVIAWSRSALMAYLDRIWIGEALPGVDSAQIAGIQDSPVPVTSTSTALGGGNANPTSGGTSLASTQSHLLTQKEVDDLPTNIYIGAGLVPKRLLLAAPTSTASRSSMPSRTIGVDFVSASHPDEIFELGVKESVIFIHQQHDLLRRFNQWRVQLAKSLAQAESSSPSQSSPSPSISRTEQIILGTDDYEAENNQPPQSHCMKLTVKMEFRRTQLPSGYSSLIQKLGDVCFQPVPPLFSTPSSPHKRACIPVEPVVLYRSGVNVVRSGQQQETPQEEDPSQEPTVPRGDQFQLWIAAECESLEATSPIRLSVNVLTPPTENDVFGNTAAIQQGEQILMEGLWMARRMASKAKWTCVEEDDSNMVEWVRDQMDIQWVTYPYSFNSDSASTSTTQAIRDPRWVLQHRTSMMGLQLLTRYSRSTASGATSGDRRGRPQSRTPVLSPYASRTNSFVSKPRQSHLRDHQRNSTLDRLQKVTDKLEASSTDKSATATAAASTTPSKSTDSSCRPSSTMLKAGGLSIPEVEESQSEAAPLKVASGSSSSSSSSSASSASSATARRSLVTSFGGFSSARSSREGGAPHHSPDLEPAMDYLGLALAGGSAATSQTNFMSSSPPADTSSFIYNGSRSSSVNSSSRNSEDDSNKGQNMFGSTSLSSSPPTTKPISRFSIKAYRMERDSTGQTGLGPEWDIGGGGLGIFAAGTNDGVSTTDPIGATPSRVKSLAPGPIQTDGVGRAATAGGGRQSLSNDRLTPDGSEPPTRSLFPGISSVNRASSGSINSLSGSSSGGSTTNTNGFRANRNSFVAVSSAAKTLSSSPLSDDVPDFLGSQTFGPKSSPVIRPSFTTFAASPLPSEEAVTTTVDPREKHAALAAALGVKPYLGGASNAAARGRASSPLTSSSSPSVAITTTATTAAEDDQVTPLPSLPIHGSFTRFRRSSSCSSVGGEGGGGGGGQSPRAVSRSRSSSPSNGNIVFHYMEGQDVQLNNSTPGRRRRSSTRVSIVAVEDQESPTRIAPLTTLG